MSPRSPDTLELIRQKVTMSQSIASKEDEKEYSLYAGAPFNLANQMALLDSILEWGIVPERLKPKIEMYRSFLNKQRKAYFASTSTEITQLGFILGKPSGRKSALNNPKSE